MAQAARCSARAPKIALACATLAATAASATLLVQAAARSLALTPDRAISGAVDRSEAQHRGRRPALC